MNNIGVVSMGIRCPIIREGDNLTDIVVKSILDATLVESKNKPIKDFETEIGWKIEEVYKYDINDKDVIGITESVVARAQGNYVTVDDIANYIKTNYGENKQIVLINPIYSRNRFSMILKGIARAAKDVVIYMPKYDEVGNPHDVNPFTGVNIMEYYTEIVNKEGKKCYIHPVEYNNTNDFTNSIVIYCGLHDYNESPYCDYINLTDFFHDKCEWGLLGSNKANEETLKLFPNKQKALDLVYSIQKKIFEHTGKKVEVMIYGDGCFKDPVGEIWEYADPQTSPAYTEGLLGHPNEIKLKAFADDEFKDLAGEELENALKKKIREKATSLVGDMASQGTTPRRYVDLLASLMDLTSGSGDKGCPIILIKNYFKSYADY